MNPKSFVLLNIFFLCLLSINAYSQIKNPKGLEYEWKTDTSLRSVELNEIQMVLPRHSFPTIDYPAFISKDEGLESFYSKEPVISVVINGRAKAYPLNMLTMHEISNDTLSGIPILPTFCPLCNASVVYDRRVTIDGKETVLTFEVSGMLRQSDMIMADNKTQSWWQQLMGLSIVGELEGSELSVIPSQVISVDMFFRRYPNGKILSPKTGTESEEQYGKNPYVRYDNIENNPYARFFDSSNVDTRLPAMERVVDIKGEDNYKIYPYSKLKKKGVINDQFEGIDYVLFYRSGMVSVLNENDISKSKNIGSSSVFLATFEGRKLTFSKEGINFIDDETASFWDITGLCTEGVLKGKQLIPVIHSNHFAFAFLSFYPNCIVYKKDDPKP